MEPIQQQQQQGPQGPQGAPTPASDAQAAQGQPQDPTQAAQGQEPQGPSPAPAPPVDPIAAVIAAVMSMPGPEAIRQVYKVAASAARAKTQLQAAGSQLDARGYHAILSQAPEVRYAGELLAARRELDGLAGERRRLGLEAQKARSSGNNARASIYEIQATQADAAMEQVAAGVLLWLALPAHALDPQQGQQQQAQAAQPQTSPSEPPTPGDQFNGGS
jgi:hypothetical protein